MSTNSIQSVMRSSVIAIALLIAALPAVAWSQEAPVPVAKEQAKPVKHSADWIEMRIAKLHTDLHITAAEEASWKDVALAMRDNAKSMKALIDKWAEESPKLTALESLRMQGDMAEEHVKGMHKLIPAFETLYNVMPDDQKKIADEVFARHEGRRQHKGK